MRIDNLPIKTKLIWDTTLKLHGEEPKRIYYPMLIVNQAKKSGRHLELGALVATPNNRNWMGRASEFCRLPTEEELVLFEKEYKAMEDKMYQ
jgi:hypothetical protein